MDFTLRDSIGQLVFQWQPETLYTLVVKLAHGTSGNVFVHTDGGTLEKDTFDFRGAVVNTPVCKEVAYYSDGLGEAEHKLKWMSPACTCGSPQLPVTVAAVSATNGQGDYKKNSVRLVADCKCGGEATSGITDGPVLLGPGTVANPLPQPTVLGTTAIAENTTLTTSEPVQQTTDPAVTDTTLVGSGTVQGPGVNGTTEEAATTVTPGTTAPEVPVATTATTQTPATNSGADSLTENSNDDTRAVSGGSTAVLSIATIVATLVSLI